MQAPKTSADVRVRDTELALLAAARCVAARLQQAGHETYFAGGVVRDQLLGLPIKDVDIATAARPPEVLRLFPRARKVGAAFGVMLVKLKGHFFEVATFRSDGSYSDGRRPDSVEFGSLAEDAERRDFSINGLYRHPETDALVDRVGGMADLENLVLRAIGDPHQRFAEDHLRLLRAVRFACRFGLDIDPETADAVRALAANVAGVAAERVLAELDRTWLGPDPRRGLLLCRVLGLLPHLIPELCRAPDRERRLACLSAWAGWPERELAQGWALVLADLSEVGDGALQRDAISRAMAERVLVRLRASNRLRADVGALHAGMHAWRGFAELSRAERLRSYRRPLGPASFELAALQARAAERSFAAQRVWRRTLEGLPREAFWPAKLIDGKQLSARGYARGPQLATILEAIETAQLEGSLDDASQLDAFLARNFPLTNEAEP